MNTNFWRGKRVFLTGHTGFKGSWLSRILLGAGARLTGYALEPSAGQNDPSGQTLFSLCGVQSRMTSITGDIRDRDALLAAFERAEPEIVLHMAAQPIVRDSYRNPAYTYETNVMGTVNILECVRLCGGVKSFLNVTTDKVYRNNEWEWGYRETDALDGFDPYSNSKSCSELVTHSYKRSFFADGAGVQTAISTARAGNVIGGGDFAPERIIPDCVRAAMKKETVILRNPRSTRPYQHVLEPLFAYLMIAKRQYMDGRCADSYNVGSDDRDCVSTAALAEMFCKAWGEGLTWESRPLSDHRDRHEANFLKLDCSRLKKTFGWSPKWNTSEAVEKTVEWFKCHLRRDDVRGIMDKQIAEYLRAAPAGETYNA